MIKFRGNRKDNGEEVKGDLSIGSAKHGWDESVVFIIPRQPLLSRIEVIPESVAQYTTLNDKKRTEEYPEGQEIYGSIEINGKMSKGGDMVQMNELENHVRVAVVWCAKEARFTYDTKAFSLKCYTVEVIGRQYDEKGKT